MLYRSLFAAFDTWRGWAGQQAELKKKLQGAVCKLTHQQLAAAWQAWRERASHMTHVKTCMQASQHPTCFLGTSEQRYFQPTVASFMKAPFTLPDDIAIWFLMLDCRFACSS